MLEIIIVIVFAKKLAEIAANKGRSKGWAALGVGGWILGELIGAVIGVLIMGEGLGMYAFALVGAAIGAGVAWMIVNNLSATEGALEFGDDYQYGHADPNNPYSPPGHGRRD